MKIGVAAEITKGTNTAEVEFANHWPSLYYISATLNIAQPVAIDKTLKKLVCSGANEFPENSATGLPKRPPRSPPDGGSPALSSLWH